jgi:CubicO group peptidase (beta-lactamase class C family)
MQRTGILILAVALAAAAPLAAQQPAAWPRATFEQQGMQPAPILAVVESARTGGFGNVDRLVVIRNGSLVLSERFGLDYRTISRGRRSYIGCGIDACTDSSQLHHFNYLHPDWHPYYQGRDVHTLQSVTKSVTSALFGVALARGELQSVETPLLSFFGSYDLSRVDPRLERATLADLLTMRSGIEWHEQDRPLDETNTTIQLEASQDWIRFTLSQPMDAEPGTKWAYNSGGSALMAEVLRAATGVHVDRYAEQHLFGPLGIRDFHWKKTPTGHPDTEGGLYLEAEDLARIGQLFLDDGVWNGTRILPAGWARESTLRHVDRVNAAGQGYGYQWWRMDRGGVEVWAGNGFGGQFLFVLPAQRIVAVVNSWNVFGTRAPSIVAPFLDALIASVPASR